MRTLYLLQHQHGGRLTQYVFSKPPTDAQMEVVGEEADLVYKPGWLRVCEILLIEDEIPPCLVWVADSDSGPGQGGNADIGRIRGNGFGTVINTPEFENSRLQEA